jgi:predicted nucleotidyltransferase component of viral defense system
MNPEYLQLKIQYQGVIGRNWIKVDVTKNDLVEKPVLKPVRRTYSDYPVFRIRVESPEEIFASKLRTVIERKKCRDYFDLWLLSGMKFDGQKIRRTFLSKCTIKKIVFKGKRQIFPVGLQETLKSYWERELGRLINPVPEMKEVLDGLRDALKFL